MHVYYNKYIFYVLYFEQSIQEALTSGSSQDSSEVRLEPLNVDALFIKWAFVQIIYSHVWALCYIFLFNIWCHNISENPFILVFTGCWHPFILGKISHSLKMNSLHLSQISKFTAFYCVSSMYLDTRIILSSCCCCCW